MDQTLPASQSLFPDDQKDEFEVLRGQLQQASLPQDLTKQLLTDLVRLERMIAASGYRVEFDRELRYIEFVSRLPFNKSSQDILDLKRAAQILEKNHYGLHSVKDRILEYLSVLILNHQQGNKFRAPILAFVGLVGSGKTSLAYSIAESLGRKLVRIPFGGLGSIKDLRGESRINSEAEPGYIMKAVHDLGVNNPLILLDEIDRVAAEARSDIMGVLVELLDPEQNNTFVDHFVDYPFDLSNAMFIATSNNTANIATAVLDRMEIIEMPSYTDEEKITIGKQYLLPKAERESGIKPGLISIDESIWPQVVRPLGYDAGIRSLQRTIQKLVRKVAHEIVSGNPGPYHLNPQNVGKYLEIE